MRRLLTAVGASVVLAALALVQAQERKDDGKKEEPKPPVTAPAAPPQDKVVIPGSIESWYKVVQADQHVGYVKEILTRSGPAPVRYDYTVLSEIETDVQDPQDPQRRQPMLETISINARLDDTYAPIDMSWKVNRNNMEVTHSVIQVDTGRRLETRLPNDTTKTFLIRSDVDLYYTAHLMFVAMRQNGVLTRTGLHTAKVLYPRTEDAPVVDVQFEVKDWVQREYLGKKVSVTRIDWVKPLPAASRDAEIVETYVDKFGRVVEEVTRGDESRVSLKIVLVKNEDEAVAQSTNIRLGARRDPFRKDLAMILKPADKAGAGARKTDDTVRVDKLDEGIKLAEKLMEELKKAVERKEDEEARKRYERIIAVYIQLKDLLAKEKDANPETTSKVNWVKTEAERLYGGAEKIKVQAQKLYTEAMDHFNRENVQGMEKALADLRKLESRPELVGAQQLTVIKGWIMELDPLLVRCKRRLELARKKLVLTGVVLHFEEKPQVVDASLNVFGHSVGAQHGVRFIRAMHFAIINDKMYKEGDMVEGEGVRVDRISKYSVQVSLKEETRDVGIRQ